MGKVSDFLKRVSSFFSGDDSPAGSGRPTIEIRGRNDSTTQRQQRTSSNPPRIKIGVINQRLPNGSGTNPYRGEVEIPKTNIGRGITVKKQRRPGRCPLCATKGKVVENVSGRDRWRCEECDSTFN